MEPIDSYCPPEIIYGKQYRMSGQGLIESKVTYRIAEIINKHLNQKKYELTVRVWNRFADDILIGPDIAVYTKPFAVADDVVESIPIFAVEVLSPLTRKKDRTIKKQLYAKYGIKEYWLVEPNDDFIEVYKPNATSETYYLDATYQKLWELDWNDLTSEEKAEFPQFIKTDFLDAYQIDIKDIFKSYTYTLIEDEFDGCEVPVQTDISKLLEALEEES